MHIGRSARSNDADRLLEGKDRIHTLSKAQIIAHCCRATKRETLPQILAQLLFRLVPNCCKFCVHLQALTGSF